jgi:CPA1 family monovalent cation:H+ antiporter
MIVGGAGIGVAVGWVFMKLHRLLPTDVDMDIVFTLVTPYVMYIAAEEVHSSGVLAVVCGGLFMANRRMVFLSSTARLRSANVWQSLVFLLNGLVFLLIGLDLPEIREGLRTEGVGLGEAIGYGLLISMVLIVVRFIAGFGALVVTRFMSHFITVADNNPGLKGPLILGWTGMRGVVSLAAALSIPVALDGGIPFPHRNLILFITFIVILTTLLVQGLTLPYIIRRIGLPDYKDYLPDEEAESLIEQGLARHALDHLQTRYGTELTQNTRLQQLAAKWETTVSEVTDEKIPAAHTSIYLDILTAQRQWLMQHNRQEHHIDEEVIRKYLRQVDMEEERVRKS